MDVMSTRLNYAKELIAKALTAGPVVMRLGRENKTREQEKKYHALINDISKQVDFNGIKHNEKIWKALLVDSFEQELFSQGSRLSHGSKTVISLDGIRAVTVRASTTEFKKKEGSNFIEYLYSFGSCHDVKWSEKANDIYNETQSDKKQ